jgi:uncharacterized repeat protein (TIGR01451 family)
MRRISILTLAASMAFSGTYAQLHVSTSGTKHVLVEIATGAWAGYCPDAFQDAEEKILPYYPNAIIAAWHNGDSMQVSGDPFNSGTGYISGFPSATIDRGTFTGTIAQMRPWESFVGTESALTPNFDVDMLCTYNPTTRVMDVTVTGRALATLTGSWNISALVIEDSISSAGTYAQHNYYGTTTFTSCTGSPSWYNSGGNPISPASLFPHSDVVRQILCTGGSIWGESAFTNPTAGATVMKHYTYTVPSTSNPFNMKVVGMVQKYGATTSDRAVENAVSSQTRLMPPGSVSITADSFTVYTGNDCSGTGFYVTTASYRSGLSIYSEYGDGSSDSHTILSAGPTGYANFSHAYTTSGTYTVKQKLYDGTTAIDSTTYSNTYVLCNVIPVMFYLDANSNCVKDTTESLLYQPTVTLVDSNGVHVDTISATSGFYYTAYGNPGDVYKFTPISTTTGLVLTCPTSGYQTDTLQSGASILPVNYFAEECSTSGSAFDLRIFTTRRAGSHSFRGQIAVDNLYCVPTTGTVTMTLNPRYNFMSAYPAPTSVSGGIATWNAGSLSSAIGGPSVITWYCESPSGTFYAYGDTVYTDYNVDPTTGDADPTSNSCVHVDTVTAGYDPNYMDVSPEGMITAGTTLKYTIAFENTGNDTAFNIRIMDTLSDNVDINSLRLEMSTAKMMISNFTSGGHHIVKFDFPMIELLDSTHHGKCDGMVVFNIKTKPGLPVGTTIYNRAGIYFDNNPVVGTNRVADIIGNTSKVSILKQNTVQVYPNPATDELNIKMNQSDFSSFTVTNSMGQTLIQQPLTNTLTKTNIKFLPAGVYYITLKGENGNQVQRFVKQ